MRLFVDIEVTRREIENVAGSAAADPEIVSLNLSTARRMAKEMVEHGSVLEHMDISFPFSQGDFNVAITERLNKIGERNVSADWISTSSRASACWSRSKAAGGGQDSSSAGRLGNSLQRFGEAIGVTLEPTFEFAEADFGLTHCDGARPIPWRGTDRNRSQESKGDSTATTGCGRMGATLQGAVAHKHSE